MFQPGEWAWSLAHQQVCKVVETQELWGETLYRIWLPGKDAVVRLTQSCIWRDCRKQWRATGLCGASLCICRIKATTGSCRSSSTRMGGCLRPQHASFWDQLLGETPSNAGQTECEESSRAYQRVEEEARQQGQPLYRELVEVHRRRIAHEEQKGDYAFAARRRALGRIGLPAVRKHRLNQLDSDQAAWREKLQRQSETSPELAPLILLWVEGKGA